MKARAPLSVVSGLVLFLLVAAGGVPSRAAAPQPARVGTYVVSVQLRCSGSSSGATADGSTSWGDSYDCSLSSVARFLVVQDGLHAYETELIDGQTTLTVSGGGHSSFKAKDLPAEERVWTYEAPDGMDLSRPSAGGTMSTEAGEAFAGSPSLPGLVIRPPDVSAFTGGWNAANDAVLGLDGGFHFTIPGRIEAWSFSQTRSTNVSYSGGVFPGASGGTATLTAKVQFLPDNAPQWEAILEPGPPAPLPGVPAYTDWLPEGNLREGSDTPGNGLAVRVHLQARDGGAGIPPKARFRFQLGDVSREPGVLMNFPPTDRDACDPEPSGPYDLRIHPGAGLDVAPDGQSAQTLAEEAEFGVGIASYDFGAYGRLTAMATLPDGTVLVAHRKGAPDDTVLQIPEDKNQNHVADAWERGKGVYDWNLPADWDGAEIPAGQGTRGDGLSLYEKYRGVLVQNALGRDTYERLDPRLKHVFVFNPDGLVREVFASAAGHPVSYAVVGDCEIRFIGPGRWTGPGAFGDRKRVVNFNCSTDKHAVDQHAIDIHLDSSPNPENPDDIQELYRRLEYDGPGDPKPSTEGRAYRDPSAPEAALAEWRPAANLRIEIYLSGVAHYVQSALEYHTVAACPGCVEEDFERSWTDYAKANAADAKRKHTLELSATITHEMGHATGVRHHDPTRASFDDPTLRFCTMRYYVPGEYPADPADRYELAARGENPAEFCRRRFNCWSRIRITDNLKAEPGMAVALAASGRPVTGVGDPPPAALGGLAVQGELELSADLLWDEVYAQDPVRLRVRLHGPTDGLSPNWAEGLRFRLSRVRPDGVREEVLPAGAWADFLQPVTFDTGRLAIPNVTRLRDLLVPAGRAGLGAGRFELGVEWDGRALAAAAILPAGGVATAPLLAFDVQAATSVAQRAAHLRHLAWERYLLDDPAGALPWVVEAEGLDARAADPLALRTRLLAMNCSARTGDALGVARYAQTLRTRGGDDNDHLLGIADSWFTSLAPRLRVRMGPGPGSGGPASLEVQAVPGGRYLVERSTDLVTWGPISTNTPSGSRFEVIDDGGGLEVRRFYRVQWLR